jgi:hypothetical protein
MTKSLNDGRKDRIFTAIGFLVVSIFALILGQRTLCAIWLGLVLMWLVIAIIGLCIAFYRKSKKSDSN